MKQERHHIKTLAREIKRIVPNSLTPRFPNETCMYAMKGDFELQELKHRLARVEKFRSDESRSAPSHALAVVHAGGGQTGTGGGACGRGREGKRSGGCHDDGRGRNQQGHPRQMHPRQQHQSPAAMSQLSHAWQQQQQYQPRFAQLQQQGPHHQQPNPWRSWGRPPHQPASGEEERTTSVDQNIGKETSLTSSASCVSSAARRSISPQTA